MWFDDPSGNFSVKSLVKTLGCEHDDRCLPLSDIILRDKYPKKSSFLAGNSAIPQSTYKKLCRKDYPTPASPQRCVMCLKTLELEGHLSIFCELASRFWGMIIASFGLQTPIHANANILLHTLVGHPFKKEKRNSFCPNH